MTATTTGAGRRFPGVASPVVVGQFVLDRSNARFEVGDPGFEVGGGGVRGRLPNPAEDVDGEGDGRDEREGNHQQQEEDEQFDAAGELEGEEGPIRDILPVVNDGASRTAGRIFADLRHDLLSRAKRPALAVEQACRWLCHTAVTPILTVRTWSYLLPHVLRPVAIRIPD